MSKQAERIFEQAPDTDARIDALWAAEAESRIAAYHRGEITTIPAEAVFDEIDAEAD